MSSSFLQITFNLIALLGLVPSLSHALQWEVIGPCSPKPLFHGLEVPEPSESLGAYSIRVFNNNKIPYQGVAQGLNSIANSPTGLDALEVLSDTSMRAYGWCFEIDGLTPDKMPDQVLLSENTKKIRWFFAYSLNQNNEWINYCQPAWKVRSEQFCSKNSL